VRPIDRGVFGVFDSFDRASSDDGFRATPVDHQSTG
jgi:hypothetical protein